jgi:hypothetical protein
VTDDTGVRVIAVLQLLTAVGIAGFWTTWLRGEHTEPWLPTGYVEHETPFVFADTVLAVLLTASAVLLLADRPLGASLALVASGMLAFLGILDLAYFWRQGLFAPSRGGVVNAGVVASVLVLSIVLALRFA